MSESKKPGTYLEDIAKLLDLELVDRGRIEKIQPEEITPSEAPKSKPVDDLLNQEFSL